MKLWHDEYGYIMHNLRDLADFLPSRKRDEDDPTRADAGWGPRLDGRAGGSRPTRRIRRRGGRRRWPEDGAAPEEVGEDGEGRRESGPAGSVRRHAGSAARRRRTAREAAGAGGGDWRRRSRRGRRAAERGAGAPTAGKAGGGGGARGRRRRGWARGPVAGLAGRRRGDGGHAMWRLRIHGGRWRDFVRRVRTCPPARGGI